MAETPAADTGAYWNSAEVAEHFSSLPPPPYLLELLAARPPARLASAGLDAGCGAGRNLAALANAGYRVIGFDFHGGMLQAARRSCAVATALQANVLAIPLHDDCVEVVVCHGVLHNLACPAEIDRALHELARVTCGGGRISLNMFSSLHIDPCLKPTGDPDGFALPNGQRMTLLSPDSIQHRVAAAGLAVQGAPVMYLSPGDPGQRSVWRAIMTPVRDAHRR